MKLDMLAFTGVFGEEHEALNKSSFCRFVLFRIGSGQIRLNIIAKTTLYSKHLINSCGFWATNSSSSQGTQAPGLG